MLASRVTSTAGDGPAQGRARAGQRSGPDQCCQITRISPVMPGQRTPFRQCGPPPPPLSRPARHRCRPRSVASIMRRRVGPVLPGLWPADRGRHDAWSKSDVAASCQNWAWQNNRVDDTAEPADCSGIKIDSQKRYWRYGLKILRSHCGDMPRWVYWPDPGLRANHCGVTRRNAESVHHRGNHVTSASGH
jgi:hypothetical protein